VLRTALGAAEGRARGLRRTLRAQHADEEDFRQAILLDLICRADRFEDSRGVWPAFVSLVTRHTAARLARNQIRFCASSVALTSDHDIADDRYRESAVDLALDLRSALRRLPRRLQNVVNSIVDAGSLAGAQRASAMSSATFYRAVRELRLHLAIAGASLPQATSVARTDRTFGSVS
jgi:hypothetical protein